MAVLAACGGSPSLNGPLNSGGGVLGRECGVRPIDGQRVLFSVLATTIMPPGEQATITSVTLVDPKSLSLRKALVVPIMGTVLAGEGLPFPLAPQYVAETRAVGVDWPALKPAVGYVVKGSHPVDLITVVQADGARGTSAAILVGYTFDGNSYDSRITLSLELAPRC